jgi:N-acetylglucosamine-6-phosphate deacetylase
MINCVGVEPSVAVSMASTVPARAIGLDHDQPRQTWLSYVHFLA